ncbi:senecionine N-oxygenase-like isoform X2 [Choristoneura fumiferana]|uniref:senecionine N-oxygenase-like isoform X2 n=1 Tax=Choristoneura fumiferana TaxID=7141 RepID=UPI003D15680B
MVNKYGFLFLVFDITSKFSQLYFDSPSPKACVIGAGYGGLASARYLKDYGVDFMVFEAQRGFGGNWRFQDDIEEDGLPPFTGVYKKLRTNTPRQTMEFSNFTFPDSTPSYPSAPCFYKYLQNFTREFDLEKYIQFRSLVTSVKWADKQWEIAYTKTDTGAAETVNCDYVIVSIGHYNRPKVPKFEGQDSFRGNIIHTQKYKDPEVFRDRRVLLVGAGASGLDLATHLSNVTSRLVHSHHLRYNQPYFGENYVKKPDIKMFTSTGVIFQDDSYEEIEDVILATGYDFDFSFLDESCGLTVSSKYVLPVYQYMVNIRRPSMVILALPKPIITRALDVQAEYAAALIAGKFQLPSQGDMLKSWLKHVYELQSKGKKIVDVNFLDNLQDQYFANLTEEAGITRVAPVLTDIRDFNAVNRLEDLLNYRDYDYELLDAHSYKRFYNPRNETCDIKVS